MTEQSSEPRFINPHERIVYVNRPDGHQIVVRPYRELGVIAGRSEKDCVVVGEHYRQFGQLIPFPDPVEVEEEEGDVAPPGVGGISAGAQNGRFHGQGDVIAPDGTVRRPEPSGDEGAGAGGEGDSESDSSETDATSDDDVTDAPLTDVPGIGEKLADQLIEFGIPTAAALADLQGENDPTTLADNISGIRNATHASKLIEAAQDTLGYEDVDADED